MYSVFGCRKLKRILLNEILSSYILFKGLFKLPVFTIACAVFRTGDTPSHTQTAFSMRPQALYLLSCCENTLSCFGSLSSTSAKDAWMAHCLGWWAAVRADSQLSSLQSKAPKAGFQAPAAIPQELQFRRLNSWMLDWLTRGRKSHAQISRTRREGNR